MSLGEALTLGKEMQQAWQRNTFLKPATHNKQILGS